LCLSVLQTPESFSDNCPQLSSRKSTGGSTLLPFTDDGGHCAHWDLQWCRNVSVPFSRSVPQYNPVWAVYRQCLGPHGLVCALTCTVNCGTLYRWVCVFQIMSNQLPQFTTGGLQSSCRNTSRMMVETGYTWAQIWVSWQRLWILMYMWF